MITMMMRMMTAIIIAPLALQIGDDDDVMMMRTMLSMMTTLMINIIRAPLASRL